MLLIFSIIFATQPLHLEGLSCKAWEYAVNQECCPMCSQGQRVLKHCTVDSSTTCLPCTEGTYTEHPNGLTACRNCQQCDPGANLKIKEQCTYTKNTMCTCIPGYFCIHHNGDDCEVCQKHTVSPPGYMVTQPGTETSDTEFVPCSSGTFSATEMSSSCKPWTNCSQLEQLVLAGTETSDTICEHRSTSTGIILGVIIIIFVAVCTGAFVLWILKRRKKGTRKGAASEQGGPNREYFPIQECGPNMVTAMQETAQNHGEPTYKAV